MNKTTDELLKILISKGDMQKYIEENSNEFLKFSLCQYLNQLLTEHLLSHNGVFTCIRGIIDRLQKTGFIVIARGGCFLLCVPRQIAQRNVLVFSAMPERETVCLAAKQQRGFFRV